MHDVLIGYGLGFLVALQIGPLSLFLIRSTLRHGVRVGLAIGAGIALVDLLYASAGAAGAAPLLGVDAIRIALGVVGAGVLAFLGIRTIWTAIRVRSGMELESDAATPVRAFVTSVAATASNPLTIASWAAIFGAAASGTGAAPLTLLLGIGVGSATWVSLLAVMVAAARRAIGVRGIRLADGIAGLGMLGFAGLLSYRALQES